MKRKPTAFEEALVSNVEQRDRRIANGLTCTVCDVLGCIPLAHHIDDEPLSDKHAFTFAVNLLRQPGGEHPKALLFARYVFAKEVARRATAASGYRHCMCKFNRENAGKEIRVHDGKIKRWRKEILSYPPPCDVCRDTGWCL